MIIVCGDSFNVGIGLEKIEEERYGTVVGNHFDCEVVTLARGSSSNYGVFLQGQYAASMKPIPKFIILSVTNYDRIEWIQEDTSKNIFNLSLENLNYHEYPPHNYPQPGYNKALDFYLSNKGYEPLIYTEQVCAIDEHLHRNIIYPRFISEPTDKLELLYDYYFNILSYKISFSPIKRDYDNSLILNAYTQARNNNIGCIVMTDDKKLIDLLPENHVLHHNWFKLAEQFPDTLGTLHADKHAHQLTAQALIKKIDNYENSI